MNSSHPTGDYLEKLFNEARQADFAAIVVGYEQETRFIWSAGDDPAAKLEALLESGGRPFAILGADIIGNAFVYRLNPFPEYEDNAGTHEYLTAIGNHLANILEQRVAATRN